jgi:hypothetical protein
MVIKWFAYIPEPKGQAKLSKANFVGVLRSQYKRQILAQVVLDKKIFGEIPEEWESNPYGWSFHLQYEQ